MSNNKTLLLIAGVAIMLAGATNAYGYDEDWDGWFNSGYLICLDSRFDYTSGSGILEDMTDGDVDEFFVSAVTPSTFTCESGEYEGYYIKLWPDASGSKPTGQNGHKEVNSGATWTGYAILYIPDPPGPPQTVDLTVSGTWDTADYYDYFNYNPATPTYSADWHYGSSSPAGIITDGEGGSAGELQE